MIDDRGGFHPIPLLTESRSVYVSFCTKAVVKAQKMPWEKVGDRRLANRKANILLIAFALLPHILGLAALTIHVMSNRMHHYVPHANSKGNCHSIGLSNRSTIQFDPYVNYDRADQFI